MSYNVDTWKTKELLDLRVPVASLFKHARSDWHPTRTDNDDGTVTFSVMEECNLRGTIDGNNLLVADIEMCGEGSGTALSWIVEPALRDSTGRLIAVRVWEGGDSIDKLVVEDGKLKVMPIEL